MVIKDIIINSFERGVTNGKYCKILSDKLFAVFSPNLWLVFSVSS